MVQPYTAKNTHYPGCAHMCSRGREVMCVFIVCLGVCLMLASSETLGLFMVLVSLRKLTLVKVYVLAFLRLVYQKQTPRCSIGLSSSHLNAI